uniref:Uncharacterized protein n=1 Tax=Globodera rostochiensis TaxID=31243 RepID=A0A914HPQ8_GLORO
MQKTSMKNNSKVTPEALKEYWKAKSALGTNPSKRQNDPRKYEGSSKTFDTSANNMSRRRKRCSRQKEQRPIPPEGLQLQPPAVKYGPDPPPPLPPVQEQEAVETKPSLLAGNRIVGEVQKRQNAVEAARKMIKENEEKLAKALLDELGRLRSLSSAQPRYGAGAAPSSPMRSRRARLTVLSPHSSDHQKVPDKQSLLSIRSTFPISQSASSRIHQSESANLRRLANQERTARARKFPPPEPNSTSAAIHLTSHCHLRPPVRFKTLMACRAWADFLTEAQTHSPHARQPPPSPRPPSLPSIRPPATPPGHEHSRAVPRPKPHLHSSPLTRPSHPVTIRHR